MASGDFNNDSKTDLAVGAHGYSNNTGRAYIFYNDGTIPTTAGKADVIINGEASSFFGTTMTGGDFNDGGKTDLGVEVYSFIRKIGRNYIFYNDSLIIISAQSTDADIGGIIEDDKLGITVLLGDFDNSNKANLCVKYIGGIWQGEFYLYEVDTKGLI